MTQWPHLAPEVLLAPARAPQLDAPGLAAADEFVVLTLLGALVVLVWSLAVQRRRAERRAREMAMLSESLRVSQDRLRASEQRYALAAQGANDGLWDWDLETGIVYYSPRWLDMLGVEPRGFGDTLEAWLERVHPDDLPHVRAALDAHVGGHTSQLESELRVRHADGAFRWMLTRGLAVRDAAGRATRLAGSQTDITARKEAEARLLHDALHDALTGLPNRAFFSEMLSHAIARAKRVPERRFAVLFLDVDRFKVVNDSLGHMAGDELLTAVARRLAACLRPGDVVARLGGDEFTILLDDMRDIGDATRVAERIHHETERPFRLAGREVHATVSIGIAPGSSEYDRPEDLLRDADLAMYRAKVSGKARYEVFDVEMRVAAQMRLSLEHDLRRALENRELIVHYQPIVSLVSGHIAGFEALARWRHPERGLINAAAFIPLAEETGLIDAVGEYVLLEACKQTRAWQLKYPQHPPVEVSVNLSPRELGHARVVHRVERVLRETGLPPTTLRLEITESVLVDGTPAVTEVLNQLKELGVQLDLDDFGTGYSSLSYLHRLPVDAVKIDRYFVSRLEANAECLAIVRSILELARTLGVAVVAEGAETEAQRLQLVAMSCPLLQGYIFSRPVAPDRAGDLLAAQARGMPAADLRMIASAATPQRPHVRFETPIPRSPVSRSDLPPSPPH